MRWYPGRALPVLSWRVLAQLHGLSLGTCACSRYLALLGGGLMVSIAAIKAGSPCESWAYDGVNS